MPVSIFIYDNILIIYSYFTGNLYIFFYFTDGYRDQFGLQNIKTHERSERYFEGQMGKGNPRWGTKFPEKKIVVESIIVFWNSK